MRQNVDWEETLMKDKLYKMMNWPEIEAIVYGEEGRPQTILGRHNVSNYTLFQTFMPDAKEVKLVLENDDKEYIMEMADEEGFYAIAILGKVKGSYYYMVTDINGIKHKVVDPYDFADQIDDFDKNRFTDGTMYDAYRFFGAHMVTKKKTKGVMFRVWAPNAIRVSVIGDFNNWNGKSHPMIKDEETGTFSLFIPGLSEGAKYKYELSIKGGRVYSKLDPYSVKNESDVSVVTKNFEYSWNDAEYIERRSMFDRIKSPLSVYEFNIDKLIKDGGLSNKDKINQFVTEIEKKGYLAILADYNADSVYMLPEKMDRENLCDLVSTAHEHGICVVLKWNPCGFVPKEEGLQKFDGTYLYGHLDDKRRYNPLCDGYNYNYGRPEVDDYLLSAGMFWMEEFHMDGLHIDGLSSIIYLDYGKYDGEWTANMYGGHENLEAIEFIKHLNSIVHMRYPYAIMTTKEVGAYPNVTERLDNDGLGFDYIWNNGYSEDYIDFMKHDGGLKNIHKLTDNMAYAYSENYMLTISYEDVVAALECDYLKADGDGTYWDYIPVDDDKKAAVKRATLAYMYAHPGKKLIYMNQDDEKEITRLNEIYIAQSALYSLDCNPYGFEWINAVDRGDGVVSFMRKDEYLNHSVFVVCNFSNNEYPNYKFGIPYEGKYKMIFTSDDKKYGGNSSVTTRAKETKEENYDSRANSLTLKLTPMSVSYYTYTPYTEEELLKFAEDKVARFKEKLEKEAREKAKELKAKTTK